MNLLLLWASVETSQFRLYIIVCLWLLHVQNGFLAHLSQRLKWAFLITMSVVRRGCHKLFKFSSSSPEPLCQFQPNLARSILGWRGITFVPKWDNNKIAKFKYLLILNYLASFMIYVHVIIALLKCIHWFKLVSRVSDVAHGPLV